jgi:hypothetical protein
MEKEKLIKNKEMINLKMKLKLMEENQSLKTG